MLLTTPYKVYEMAISSILENIKIDNPEFIKRFVDAMDAPTDELQLKKRTKTTITVADASESKLLSELRHKRRTSKK